MVSHTLLIEVFKTVLVFVLFVLVARKENAYRFSNGLEPLVYSYGQLLPLSGLDAGTAVLEVKVYLYLTIF